MAVRMPRKAKPKPIELDKWLGINEAVGKTEIQLGEAIEQTNFRVTKNYKLEKRAGFTTKCNLSTGTPIRGLWSGTLQGNDVVLASVNGKLYELSKEEL